MSEKDLTVIPETTEPLETGATSQLVTLAENTKLLNNISKLAKMYATSTIIPNTYQGKPDNCFVAIEVAGRMGVSPTFVMQNLYVVQGRPSWSGQACIALINGCGKFDDLEFEFFGKKGSPEYGCKVSAVRKSDGKRLEGTAITMQMAQDEGWLNKGGSKWKTMPDQMLMYRAAAFFARVHCPNVLMGFQTVEELGDITPDEQPKQTISL